MVLTKTPICSFGEKAKEVRNTSLVVPHGETGTVIAVDKFVRDGEHGAELQPGVNELVRVYGRRGYIEVYGRKEIQAFVNTLKRNYAYLSNFNDNNPFNIDDSKLESHWLTPIYRFDSPIKLSVN